ncbi:hypothetical protein IID19_04300 [Patescibacteria group bacterium]|nr:hypothetical protein [Patescibacteria group bacterium]
MSTQFIEVQPGTNEYLNSSAVECHAFYSCKCSICGGLFADGDDICSNGHQIGKKYLQDKVA